MKRLKPFIRWDSPLYLMFWIALAYLPFIWKTGLLLTGDQKTYLRIAQEMFTTGDWLHPRLFGETCYLKPPLQYWATLLGMTFFGNNAVGAYLPSALAMMATSALLWRMEAGFFARPAGLAALFFAFSMGTYTYAQSAQMEIYLVWLWTQAWYFGWKHLHDRKWKSLAWAFLSAGLLALVKSPLYSGLWTITFFAVAAFRKDFWLFRSWRSYLSLALGVLVGVSWYFAVYWTDRDRFWTQYIQVETFGKKGGNSGSVLHMWADFSTFLWPLLLLIPAALWQKIRKAKSLRIDRKNLLVAGMVLPGAVFFSLFPYRTETYLYLLTPGVFLGLGQHLDRKILTEAIKKSAWLSGVAILLAGPFLGWIVFQLEVTSWWIYLFFTATSVLSGWSLSRMRWKVWVPSTALWILALRLLVIDLNQADYQALYAMSDNHPQAQWMVYDPDRAIWGEAGVFGIQLGTIVDRKESLYEMLSDLRARKIAILSEEDYQQFKTLTSRDELKATEWLRWKKRESFPWWELILHGKSSISDWNMRFSRKFYLVERAQP